MVEDIRLLIAWRPSGVRPEVIGQHLTRPRSANAVRAKARRLGLGGDRLRPARMRRSRRFGCGRSRRS